MSSETNHIVAYDNYDNFQHVNLIFSQNFISLFWGLFNDETDPRIRKSFKKVLKLSMGKSSIKAMQNYQSKGKWWTFTLIAR
jgi:hypothetical protein